MSSIEKGFASNMQFIILFLILSYVNCELFAGVGLQTRSYHYITGEELLANCTTADDCYELFCKVLYGSVEYTFITMDKSTVDCNSLDRGDKREMAEEFITEKGNYTTYSVSQTSYMLCRINEAKLVQPIKSFTRQCGKR